MQKFTKTELHWIIAELENTAEDVMQMVKITENYTDRVFLELKAENLWSIAEKFRLALDNEDKRIAIV